MLAVAQKEPKDTDLRAAKELDAVRGDPLALHVFLKRMPKGADLHNHLDGAVYAETFIRVGGEDGLCVDPTAKAFTKSQPIKSGAEPAPVCEAGDVPAAKVPKNQRLYDELVDFVLHARLRPLGGRDGARPFLRHVREIRRHRSSPHRRVSRRGHRRAAAQNEQYLELMETPTWHRLNDHHQGDELGARISAHFATSCSPRDLADDVPAARAFWDKAEAVRRERGQCGEPDELPAARSRRRYIYQVFRNTPKELVFAQTVFGFELASADPRVVAINFVGGEDESYAMTDYAEHMRMVGFLRELYPKVRVSLHAGELAPGLVPPEGLCCHVRLAVEQARTDRIGHGVDVMYEDRPYELLKNMADKGVLVEINLTSNEVILGIKRQASSRSRPIAISACRWRSRRMTKASRASISPMNMSRAVETYGLSYADLKEMVRNSLEYSFLPGLSLWDDKGGYARVVPDCLSDVTGPDEPSAKCASFLAASEKAAQQWELERRFQAFESGFAEPSRGRSPAGSLH